MKLSVIVPGIRTQNWKRLYDSVGIDDFEMIFVGPNPPVEEMPNSIFIQDYGTPIRCQQIGLLACKGEYVTWAADDGFFLEGALQKALSLVGPNKIVMGKYYEGDGNESEMGKTVYYRLNYHGATYSPFIGESLGLNVGLISRELLLEVGGWDCQFEVCPMAYADLAIRLQRKYKFIIQNEVMFKCGHMPGTTGDHGPIHYAQTEHDEPLYHQIYNNPSCLERYKIDLDNWKNAPEKWTRRFG